jgi:uncharacterized membrane protein YhaH (DUF805 family)
LPDRDQLFWLFFRFSGRVSRAAYFLGGLLLAVLQAFLLYRFTLVPGDSTEGQLWATAFMAVMLTSVWSNVALGVKRLHDLDKPGIIAASLFIPVISIIAFLVLCFLPGTPGPNRYGARTNSP